MGVTGVSMHIVPVSMHALVPVKPQATHAAIIQTKLLDAAHGALAAGIHQHTVEEGAESCFAWLWPDTQHVQVCFLGKSLKRFEWASYVAFIWLMGVPFHVKHVDQPFRDGTQATRCRPERLLVVGPGI